MENRNTSVMSIQDWIITILITSIPVVNIIMLFVWAFGSDTNENKKNWAKATLIWLAIMFVLYMIIFVFLGLALFTGSR
jgi:uncharacterized membrane protein YdjX (TVP38/TMEM64 family)